MINYYFLNLIIKLKIVSDYWSIFSNIMLWNEREKMKQSTKDVSIDLRLCNLSLFLRNCRKMVESRDIVVSQTQWFGKCVNRKSAAWVFESGTSCVCMFWGTETMNCTCCCGFWKPSVHLLKNFLAEVLPETHTSFKHKNNTVFSNKQSHSVLI